MLAIMGGQCTPLGVKQSIWGRQREVLGLYPGASPVIRAGIKVRDNTAVGRSQEGRTREAPMLEGGIELLMAK